MDIDHERLFRSFDWGNCRDWQSYIRNVYPVPSLQQIERIQRKWYKRNVDAAFPIDPPSRPQPPHQQSAQPQYQRSQATNSNRRAADTLALLQVALILIAPISSHAMHFLTAVYFAGLIRAQGTPVFTEAYWSRAIRNEDVQSMVFCLLFVVFSSCQLALLPAALGAVLLACEVLRTHTQLPAFLLSLCSKVYSEKHNFQAWKSRLELLLAPVLVCSTVLIEQDMLLAFLYLQFLVAKYAYSPRMKETVAEVQTYGRGLKQLWKKAVERAG